MLILQTTLGYHSPQNSLWQDKHSPKNSPTGGDQIHLNSSSPQQLSPSGSSPNCEQNNLKRRSTESDITELEKKHIRRDGWYFLFILNIYIKNIACYLIYRIDYSILIYRNIYCCD